MILRLCFAGLVVFLFALPALLAGKLAQRLFDRTRHKRP